MFCEYNRPKNETGLRAMSSIQVAMEGQVKWTPEAGDLAATGKPLRIPWSCRKLGVPFSDDGGNALHYSSNSVLSRSVGEPRLEMSTIAVFGPWRYREWITTCLDVVKECVDKKTFFV